MFRINVQSGFEASHQLVLADGTKEELHRHNWVVVAVVSSDKLNEMGLVMDFNQLKENIDKIISGFGDNLNEVDYFLQTNPSAELVAKYVYEKLKPLLPADVHLDSVKVTEQPGCQAEFSP